MNDDNRASYTSDFSNPLLDALAEAANLSVPRGYARTPSAPPSDMERMISDPPPADRSSLDSMVALIREQILDHTPTLPTGVPISALGDKTAQEIAPAPTAKARRPVALVPPAEEMFMTDRAALLELPSGQARSASRLMIWGAAALILGALMAAGVLAGSATATGPTTGANVTAL